MSERLPRITAADAIRDLKRAGWEELRHRGGHVQLGRSGQTGRVTVAMHAGEIIRPKTLKSILTQAGLTVEEFKELL